MKTFYSYLDDIWGASRVFAGSYGLKQVSDPKDADIIVLNGGADIATSIYDEEPVSHGGPPTMSRRDMAEIELFERFKDDKSKFFVGICRGGQLLNCLNGGKLFQDVDRHYSSHPMVDVRTGQVVETTSVHHQAFRPNYHTAQIIAVASESTYKNSQELGVQRLETTKNLMKGQDVEVCYYPDTRALCIQGHPEYVPGSTFSDYCWGLIKEFFPAKAA